MNEDSSRLPQKQGLKNEWSLLIHSFVESSDLLKELFFEKIQRSGLTAIDLKRHTKILSENRKSLNLQIEKIKAEIDHLSTVAENLELVGSDIELILEQIQKINSEGERFSAEVFKIEKRIKKIHEIERAILSSNHSAL